MFLRRNVNNNISQRSRRKDAKNYFFNQGAVIKKIFYPMLGHPLELSRPSTPQMDFSSKTPFQTLDPSPIGVKLRGKIFGLALVPTEGELAEPGGQQHHHVAAAL
jgi:hypothetical protein